MTHAQSNKIFRTKPKITYIGPDNLVSVIGKANILEATKKEDMYAIPIVFDRLSLDTITNMNDKLKIYLTPTELINRFFEDELYDNDIVTNDKPSLDIYELYGTVFTTKNKNLANIFREYVANNYNPYLSREGNSVYIMNEIFGHALDHMDKKYKKMEKNLRILEKNNKKLFTDPK